MSSVINALNERDLELPLHKELKALFHFTDLSSLAILKLELKTFKRLPACDRILNVLEKLSQICFVQLQPTDEV